VELRKCSTSHTRNFFPSRAIAVKEPPAIAELTHFPVSETIPPSSSTFSSPCFIGDGTEATKPISTPTNPAANPKSPSWYKSGDFNDPTTPHSNPSPTSQTPTHIEARAMRIAFFRSLRMACLRIAISSDSPIYASDPVHSQTRETGSSRVVAAWPVFFFPRLSELRARHVDLDLS